MDPTYHYFNIRGRFPGQSQTKHVRADALDRISFKGGRLHRTSVSKTLLFPFAPATDAQSTAKKGKSMYAFINQLIKRLDVMHSFNASLCFQIIYVMRNPKDVMVSYFYFSNKMKNIDSSESMYEMLEKFFTGCSKSQN